MLKPGGLMVFSVRPNFFEETKGEWLGALAGCGVEVRRRPTTAVWGVSLF
jgi:hypothetical protein